MPDSYADAEPRTRRGEWERLSCVVGVLERTGLGILGRYQVYVTIIRSNIDDLQTKKRRKNGAYAPISLRNKNKDVLPSVSHLRTPSSSTSQLWHPVTRIEYEENDVGLVDDFV